MIDREKMISGLKEIADYFHECRSNASFGSKAEEHFWELYSTARDAAEMLKEQETWIKNAPTVQERGVSEWLEDSDPGQEYGTTWACRECRHSLHEQHVWNPYDCNWRYCPWCGRRMDFVTNMPVDEPKTLNDLLRQKHWINGV